MLQHHIYMIHTDIHKRSISWPTDRFMNQKEKVYLIVNPGTSLFSERAKQNCPYQRFRLVPQLLWRQIPHIGILSTKIQLVPECQQFQCSLFFWAQSWTHASCLCVAAEKNFDVHLYKVQQRITVTKLSQCKNLLNQCYAMSLWKALQLYGLVFCLCSNLKNCFGCSQQHMWTGTLSYS